MDDRFKSTSRVVEVNGNQSTGRRQPAHVEQPEHDRGRGGSCFGDSGGPVFINNTDDVLAVVSYGPSLTCHGADYSWRVDSESAQDFINSFLS